MKRNLPIALVLLVALAGCASSATAPATSGSKGGAATAQLAEPELTLVQISSVAPAAEYQSGGVPVQFQLQVANHSGEAITLKRVNLQSIGVGGYEVAPVSRPFDKKIEPNAAESVQFWVPSQINTVMPSGANSPVTLRCTAEFDSPVGRFQKIVVETVGRGASPMPQ